MTSKRDLRAMVERLTTQLELANEEHEIAERQVRILSFHVDRVTAQRDALLALSTPDEAA